MVIKKFFNPNYSITDILMDKKMLSKNVYGKFLVRCNLSESNRIQIIDNTCSFYNISLNDLEKFSNT
jgi:hypothetical protein